MKKKYSPITKIIRPRVKGIIQRERLFGLLDDCRKQPVTWVSGPGGSGKTTLVASYLDARKPPCLWYTVDAGDSDIASFFYYMGLAAKEAAPRYLKPMPLLTPEYLLGVAVFTQRYFEDLYKRIKPPFVIVLDNYQLVPPESPLHEVVNMALTLVPEGINVMLISRNEPPPAFIRLRAIDKIALLGWKEIRLTEEESRELVRLRERRRLADETVSLLYRKTEGWIAGLVLLIESAKTKGMGYQFIDSHTPAEIFEYFAGEAFLKADREAQDFLLKTSFLPVMTTQMTETLTGIKAAGHILSGLDKTNYFIERHQKEKPVYNYHPLFREFLMSRAKEAFVPDEIARVQRSAAALLMESGHIEDAAALLIEAGDWKGFIPFLLNHAPALMAQGRIKTLGKWLEAIPEEVVEHTPWLLYWLGISKLGLSPAESRTYLERAFHLFEAQGNDAGTLLAWSGAVQTFLFEFDDFRPLDHWVHWLDERVSRGIAYPSREIAAGVASGMTGALAWRMPYHYDVRAWVNTAIALSREDLNIDTRLRACTNSAIYYIWMGEYAECRLLIEQMKKMVQSQPASPARQIILRIAEAMLYNSSAELQGQADHSIVEGLEIARKSGVHVMDALLYLQGIASALNKGDKDGAHEFLSKMEKTIGVSKHAHSAHYFCFLSRYLVLVNDIPQAVASAKESLRYIEKAGLPVSETLIRLTLAQVLYQSGDHEEAGRQFEDATWVSAQTGSSYCAYLCDMTSAYFSFEEGDYDKGLGSLRKAFTIGRQKGFVTMIHFWRPDIIGYLCVRALEAGIEVEYAKELIRKLRLVPKVPPVEIEDWPWPVKIYALGRFDLIVDGKAVSPSGKAQKKPLLLLKTLIAFGGKDVREERLADILWPDADGDAGHNAVKTTVSRLRQMIGNDRVIQVNEGRISIDGRYCWVDAWVFEQLCERIEKRMEEVQGGADFDWLKQTATRVLSLYGGPLLHTETYENWTVATRERLRSKYLRLISAMARLSNRIGSSEEAVEYYMRGLETEPLSEEFHQGLMASYIRLGRQAEALSAYKRCKDLLRAELGITPSAKTEALREETLKAK
jgi:ATP/maltotriose-dependent transcriptional regulator MalT/DNA-binding SARP family transcriptional activator